jgi:protein SCO1/2
MQRMIQITAILLVCVGLLVSVLFATGVGPFSDDEDQFADCRTSAVAGGSAAIGGPFELVDHKGRAVTEQDVIVEPSLIYFGYTFCPDVCPFDTVRNAEAVDLLAAQGLSATPIFISIDPERDTPEALDAYVENIHPKMVGLTGTEEQVKAASKAYRTYYKRHNDDLEYYIVDHSTQTYLMLPDHGFVEFFNRNTSAEKIAETAACFIKNS